jgi:hypothetical protein
MPWSTVKASGKKLLPRNTKANDEAEMSTLIKDKYQCSSMRSDVRKQVYDAKYFNAHASDGPPEQDLRKKKEQRQHVDVKHITQSATPMRGLPNVPKSCRR